jgi:hypothetical protein
MKYIEYLNAARKHHNTCVIIKEALTLVKASSKDAARSKQLTQNLYYMSGYIIECSVKYGIYASLGYDKNSDITNLNVRGVTYKSHIKQHRFKNYVDCLNKSISGIKLIDDKSGISQEVISLYNNWDVDIRYCYSEIPPKFKHCDDVNHVFNFNTCAEYVFKYIQTNLR